MYLHSGCQAVAVVKALAEDGGQPPVHVLNLLLELCKVFVQLLPARTKRFKPVRCLPRSFLKDSLSPGCPRPAPKRAHVLPWGGFTPSSYSAFWQAVLFFT